MTYIVSKLAETYFFFFGKRCTKLKEKMIKDSYEENPLKSFLRKVETLNVALLYRMFLHFWEYSLGNVFSPFKQKEYH